MSSPHPGQTPAPTGDMKILRNLRESRPELSILPYNGMVFGSRATEYGADKYARGNYFGAPPANVDPVDRFAEYLSAAMRHLGKIAQAINVAKGTGGDARAACADLDTEASGGFPPSMLPHIAHAIAGLMIAVECGINDGLLPADPGQPWKRHEMYGAVLDRRAAGLKGNKLEGLTDVAIRAQQGLPQKDDPDAERRRVEELAKKRAMRRTGETDEQLEARLADVKKFDKEIDDGFKAGNPDWPSGVKM